MEVRFRDTRAIRAILATLPILMILAAVCATPASSIPAFARKYGTSCLTCHTIYPKLNPFGEAFRRNGYRFPAIDSDVVKQETVPMGQDAYKKQFPHAVWPDWIPASVPVAIGFNGQAVLHPDRKAGGAIADNGARVNINDLIEEGHLWTGGSFDDKITFFGELTVASDGASLENATVHFNDLVGPKHAVNLIAGKMVPTLTSFGPHSSYAVDMALTSLSVTGLYGAQGDSWNTTSASNGLEANGTISGRADYSIGTNAGVNVDVQDVRTFYASAGYKLGGVRLDAEKSSAVPDASKPWAEPALTVGGFYYRTVSHYAPSDTSMAYDRSRTFGGGIRAQWGSLEFDSGLYQERHDNPRGDGVKVNAIAQYNEVSYVYFPWLVPVVRLEYLRVKPNGEDAVNDMRIIAGIAALVRPNLKLTATAWTESAKGAPLPGGDWSASSGMILPKSDTPLKTTGPEVEAVTVGMAFAF